MVPEDDTSSLNSESSVIRPSEDDLDSDSSHSTSDDPIKPFNTENALFKTLDCQTQVSSLEFSHDGNFIAAGSKKDARVWGIGSRGAFTPVEIGPFNVDDEGPIYITLSHDDSRQYVWIASGGGTIVRRDFHPRVGISTRSIQTGHTISCIKASPDGRLLAAGIHSAVKIFDATTGNEVTTLLADGIQDRIASLSFSVDSETLTGASAGGMVVVWNMAEYEVVAGPFTQAAPPLLLSHSPSGGFVSAAGFEGKIKIWKKPEGEGKGDVVKAAAWYAGRKERHIENDKSLSRNKENRDDDLGSLVDFPVLTRRQTYRKAEVHREGKSKDMSIREKRSLITSTKRILDRLNREKNPKSESRRNKEKISNRLSAIASVISSALQADENSKPQRQHAPRRQPSLDINKRLGHTYARFVFTARNKNKTWVQRKNTRRGSLPDTDNGSRDRVSDPLGVDVDNRSELSWVEQHPLRDIFVMHLCGLRPGNDRYA
ncbi:WD40 repeat-like protein [Coniophora puteana RWD-64-598 SS2]|uniref:WD40 repeat-like protein n=1 Tax=Coniophora puteana (strain RWD-64-598) TaxID=741705 RepID=A0A5M3N495_CONPW|nr:WD40 repeat-like protein [Coniophora puteana RWD-64-598 SS2]EIW86077.1 WD40 repeat-like protein [Coniophora puteana RWD-64-598 SS2]